MNFLSSDQIKWQRMREIVNQYPSIPQSSLSLLARKRFLSRLLAENLLTFFLQYIGLMLSTLAPYSAPVWLGTGTACAFIFLRGYSILPGIWCGGFFAFYSAKAGLSIAMGAASLFAVQAFILFWLCSRFINPRLILNRISSWMQFLCVSMVLTGLISYFLLLLCMTQWQVHNVPLPLLWQWWLANLNGILIVSCGLVTLDTYFPQTELIKQIPKSQLFIWYGLLTVMIIGLMSSNYLYAVIGFALFTLLFVSRISYMFGWCGYMAAVFWVGLLLSFGSGLGLPVLSGQLDFTTIMSLPFLLVITTMIGALIALTPK